jgi:hypothetical protein
VVRAKGGNYLHVFSIDVLGQGFSLRPMNGLSIAACTRRFLTNPRLFSTLAIIVVVVLALCPARADDPEGQYLQIFQVIQDGDTLKKSGQVDKALAKYREAQVGLAKFQRSYPERDAKTVAYRLNYVSTQIAGLAPQATATGTNNATTNQASAPKGTSTGSLQVKLLEPGSEPRRQLRFHPKAGDKQTMVMTMKIGMGVKIGETPEQPIKLPTMKMIMDTTVKDVAPNGDITFEIVTSDASVVEEPDVIAQVAEAMKNAVGGMKGIGGTGMMSSRGMSKGTDIKAPEGADPQVKQFVDQMKETMSRVASPLPEEAVGAGAKWETKMPLKSQGMTLNQTATFNLVSIEGDHCVAKTTVTQTASNQKIQNPVMPGTKVDLTKMTGRGTGEVTFDLGQILPQEAKVEFHQDMATSTTAVNSSQKQTMEMRMDLSLHIAAK